MVDSSAPFFDYVLVKLCSTLCWLVLHVLFVKTVTILFKWLNNLKASFLTIELQMCFAIVSVRPQNDVVGNYRVYVNIYIYTCNLRIEPYRLRKCDSGMMTGEVISIFRKHGWIHWDIWWYMHIWKLPFQCGYQITPNSTTLVLKHMVLVIPHKKRNHRILNISSSLKYSDRPFLRVNPSKVKTMPKQTLVAWGQGQINRPWLDNLWGQLGSP